MLKLIEKLLKEWHIISRKKFKRHFPLLKYDKKYPKSYVIKRKYIYLNEGKERIFRVNRKTGKVYKIYKVYSPSLGIYIGEIGKIKGKTLVKARNW